MKKTDQLQAPPLVPEAEGTIELGVPQTLMKESAQEAIQLKLQKRQLRLL